MRKQWLVAVGLTWLLVPAAGFADTVYVSDRLPAGMRAWPAAESAVVKRLPGGTALEVLERVEGQVRVRDPQGTEGWIATEFIMTDSPARAQLDKVKAHADKLNAELNKAEAALAQESAKSAQLAKKLAEVAAAQNAPPAPSEPPSEAEAAAVPADHAADSSFSFVWLAVAFAMLIVGFAAGVIWVRETTRKRMGGMYLRI